MKLNKLIAIPLLFLLPMAVAALESDKDQPIYIESDNVEIEDGKGPGRSNTIPTAKSFI